MKSATNQLIAFCILTFIALPAYSQDDFDKRLEEKIERMVEKIENQLERVSEKLESIFEDDSRSYSKTERDEVKDLNKKLSKLQSQLSKLERKKTSYDKESELADLEMEIRDLEMEIRELEKELSRRKGNRVAVVPPVPPVPPIPPVMGEWSDGDRSSDTNRFISDKVIEKTESITGNVVVTNGNLTVYGKIEGDAISVNGHVYLKDGAVITGDVASVGGKVFKDDGAVVSGIISEVESDVSNIESRPRNSKGYGNTNTNNRTPRFDENPVFEAKNWEERWVQSRHFEPSDNDRVFIDYNRVDGLLLGLGKAKNYYWNRDQRFSIHGFLAYSFGNKLLQYEGSFDRWFNDYYRTEIGISGYDKTIAKDDWKFSYNENMAAAFFFHEDFYDFYRTNGISFHMSQFITPNFRMTAKFAQEDHTNQQNNVEWALFGGNKLFRLNPKIQEGQIRSVTFSTALDLVDNFYRDPTGIYSSFEFKKAGGALKGDFEYDRAVFETKAYVSFSKYDNLKFRMKIGGATNQAPVQELFEAGGVGTAVGYELNEFSGNRMMLFNLENVMSSRQLKNELPFSSSLNLLIFTDLVGVKYVSPTAKLNEGFNMDISDMKNSVGFGFVNDDNDFRIQFGWRTDKGSQPVQIMVRFNPTF